MDWVHQKESRRKSGQKLSTGKSNVEQHSSATLWLEELCIDKLEKLQASLPVQPVATKSKQLARVPNAVSALQWGLESLHADERQDHEVLADLIRLATQPLGTASHNDTTGSFSPQKLAGWILHRLPVDSEETCVALTAAGWIHDLSNLGRSIEPSTWLETLQTILSEVDRSWAVKEPDHLLSWLIWSCEIPLALATQLAQLGSKDRIVCETLDRLAACIEAAGEAPELWLKNGGRHLRAILACIARCRFTADRLGARKWYRAQRKALVKMVSIAVSLSDRSGNSLFVEPSPSKCDTRFWQSMVEICGKPKDVIQLIQANFGKKFIDFEVGKDDFSKSSFPALGFYSERAELAVMRSKWTSNSGRIGIDFSSDSTWIDIIGNGGKRLLSGVWDMSISKNGKPLEITDSWHEVCWFSDDDVDYLEIECKVEGECRVQRQIFLARDESVIVLADALLANNTADWTMESRMPLEDGVSMKQDDKTREAVLCFDANDANELPRQAALLLPLALPEWRRQHADGELAYEDDAVVMSQSGHGRRLYAPMAISLKKRHQSQEYTWRQLTVAENMKIQTRDVASAYRFQIGKEQWMIYRSLDGTRRRTAMGLHFNVEFYAGRFDGTEGEHESLVEVDSP